MQIFYLRGSRESCRHSDASYREWVCQLFEIKIIFIVIVYERSGSVYGLLKSKSNGFDLTFSVTAFLLLFLRLHILNYLSSSLRYNSINVGSWLFVFLLLHNLINNDWGSTLETACS